MSRKPQTSPEWTFADVKIAWELAGRPHNISVLGKMMKNCEPEALEPFLLLLPIPVLFDLTGVKTKRDNRLLAVLAYLPHTSDEQRHSRSNKIRTVYALGMRILVARNPKAPTTLLQTLSQDIDKRIRACVARNPSTPLTLLEALSKDYEPSVRVGVARNKNTSVEILNVLLKDKRANVRGSVAWNAVTTPEMFATLDKDTTVTVQTYLARSIYAPVEVLIRLADSDNIKIRRELAANPYAPLDVLTKLSKDTNPTVAHNAQFVLYARRTRKK